MSIIENHDIVQIDYDIAAAKERVKKIVKGTTGNWQDLEHEEREKLMHQMRTLRMLKARRNNLLSLDHCILQKSEFRDIWSVDFQKDDDGSSLGSYKFINKLKTKDLKTTDTVIYPSKPVSMELNPLLITGFLNRRQAYQFFQVMKISIKFESNSASNFSPIICRYAPPSTPENYSYDNNYTFIMQLTKQSFCNGKNVGYMSLNLPFYMIKQNNKYFPSYTNSLISTQFNPDEITYDFGRFVFESSNPESIQSVIVTSEWKIDFYSMIDYDNIVKDLNYDDMDGFNLDEDEETKITKSTKPKIGKKSK